VTHFLNQALPVLVPGDAVFTRSSSFLGKAIRFWERVQTGEAVVNHVGGMLDGITISEAVGRVIERPIVEAYADTPLAVYRSRWLTMEERVAIADEWHKAVGTGYPYWRMVPFMLDAVTKSYWFTRKLGMRNFRVCSNHYAHGVQAVTGQMLGGIHWVSHTPDTLHDIMRRHTQDWDCVWSTLPS
jgi:hypothetical protein